MNTADLCDEFGDSLQYVEVTFRDYGKKILFNGPIATVKCHEDNSTVKTALSEPGQGRVLVVDGGGSMRRALIGDNIASLAIKNNWNGMVIFGCIRDTAMIAQMEIGVKALGSIPRKTEKKDVGTRQIPVTFGGVVFKPDCYLYADHDGIVVADQELSLANPL